MRRGIRQVDELLHVILYYSAIQHKYKGQRAQFGATKCHAFALRARYM